MLEYKGSSLFGAQPNPKLTLLASLCSPLCPPSRCPARLRSPRAWLLPGLNPETPGRTTDVFSQGTARPHFLTPGTQHLKLTCQIVLDTLQPLKLRILFHPGALQKHPEPETERAHAHTRTHSIREQWVCVRLSIRGLTRCGSVPAWVPAGALRLQACRGRLTPAVETAHLLKPHTTLDTTLAV